MIIEQLANAFVESIVGPELTPANLRSVCEEYSPGSCARFSDEELQLAITQVLGPIKEAGHLVDFRFAAFIADMLGGHYSAAMNVAARFKAF